MKRTFSSIALSLWIAGAAFAQQPPSSNSATPAFPPHPQSAGLTPFGLTPPEWQELQLARQNALKAHPELLAQMKDLSQKMRDFEIKLHAAMVQTNPGLTPSVANMESANPTVRPPPPSMPNPAVSPSAH